MNIFAKVMTNDTLSRAATGELLLPKGSTGIVVDIPKKGHSTVDFVKPRKMTLTLQNRVLELVSVER